MPTYDEARRHLAKSLEEQYEADEARSIALLCLEEATGLTRARLLARGPEQLPDEAKQKLYLWLPRLQATEPVQYVLGHAWFYGRRFAVGPGALIPRPETEELVAWALADHSALHDPFRVADLCTGTGCIGITLAAERPNWQVTLVDISTEALAYARQNQAALLPPGPSRCMILERDVLANFQALFDPQSLDILVSNPPYVPQAERSGLALNVRDHEPGLALFVPDIDPLLFYKALAHHAVHSIKPGGAIYAELHAPLANETTQLWQGIGLKQIELKEDAFGRKRMIKARL